MQILKKTSHAISCFSLGVCWPMAFWQSVHNDIKITLHGQRTPHIGVGCTAVYFTKMEQDKARDWQVMWAPTGPDMVLSTMGAGGDAHRCRTCRVVQSLNRSVVFFSAASGMGLRTFKLIY